MGLTRVALLRPLFITMLVAALAIIGLVSYSRLGVDLYPALEIPIVSVTIAYPGAGAEAVEQLVTKPVEDAVAGLNGIDYITSTSAEGVSNVVIFFKETVDADAAAIDVERYVNSIRASLPEDTLAPSVVKFDIQAFPVLQLALYGNRSPDQLYRLADERIAPRLASVDGVAQVTITGGLRREIRVVADEARLRAKGLSIVQLNQALAAENVNVPSGTVTDRQTDFNVRLNAQVPTPGDLENLIIGTANGQPVYLKDVATVTDGYARVTRLSRVNGQESVGLIITKGSTANTVATADGVKRVLKELEPTLPPDVKIDVVSDASIFTRQSLEDVQKELMQAVLLTGLILLLFLHTYRSTIIVLLAIPTSIVSTFIVMNILGFTLNMMSTMALALSVGILVDDSIVVLENIFRHLELGETPFSAALNGRSEIGLAAITITLVDVVVYAPMAFVSGPVGQWFRQFGLVIAVATLFSLFISFTLTPMLASRWLRQSSGRRAWFNPMRYVAPAWEAGYAVALRVYGRVLDWALRRRLATVGVSLLSLVAGIMLVVTGVLSFEFLPTADQGEVQINLEMPPGTPLAVTDEATRRIEAKLAQMPEVEKYFTDVGQGGGNRGAQARFATISVKLVERERRPGVTAREVAARLRDVGADIPGATVRANAVTFAGGEGGAISIPIRGEDPEVLEQLAAQVEEVLRTTPGLTGVRNSAVKGQPEVEIAIDRRKAADLGLTASQVAAVLRTSLDGTVATQYRPVSGSAVDVRVITGDATRNDLERLARIPLVNNAGQEILLGQVASIRETTGLPQIDRRDRQRVITVSADLDGRVLGEVSTEVQRRLDAIPVPPGYSLRQGGQVEDQQEAFGQLFAALGLSIVLMFMLMVALFESFLTPLVILLSLPLASVGAFGGLVLTGNTLNLMSIVGLIMLTGLVAKNAILLVDYTNTLRRSGLPRLEALKQAGPTRLRPILMTTMALVFAMAPLAFRFGEGSELRSPMAAVVMGGLITSTLLTLVFVPVVYTYFDDLPRLPRKVLGRFRQHEPAETALPPQAAPRPVPTFGPSRLSSPQE